MVALTKKNFHSSNSLVTFVNENPVRVVGITNAVDNKQEGELTLFYKNLD